MATLASDELPVVFGFFIPLGKDGVDVARFPIRRQLYVIGRYVPKRFNHFALDLQFCIWRVQLVLSIVCQFGLI